MDSDNNLGYDGYVSPSFPNEPHISSSDYSSFEDEEEDSFNRPYDTNVPILHEYLGRLDSIRGYRVFEDGETLELVAIHTKTIISPGFTLPLVLISHEEQEIMSKCIADSGVFVVIFKSERQRGIFPFGIIMEVFETYTKQDIMHLKSRGRQRCRILHNREMRSLSERLLQITVKAIEEPDVESPIGCTQLLRLKAVRPYCGKGDVTLNSIRKYRRYHLAQFPYGAWIYDRNEVYYYRNLVIEKLKFFKDCLPTDPIVLSYWIVQNFLLTNEERLQVLTKNSVLERLKLEYQFLLTDRVICCRKCCKNLAEYRHVFAMSKDGIQTTYCNPGGYVHEILTLKKIRNYQLLDYFSKDFCWFPGYSWAAAKCRKCNDHIGWQFLSSTMWPHRFFGLARACVDVKIINAPESI